MFAVEADDEGWRGVASLFRAAAFAEQIHAANHGRILGQLGGETELFPQPVDVRGTVENLRTTLAGELFEVNTMYPAFVERARECRDAAVGRTFKWALEAGKTQARLFDEALAFLELKPDSWVWGGAGVLCVPMAKRLQVIVQDPEYRDIQRAPRLRRVSIAEWVRQALVQARRSEPSREAASKLEEIRSAARKEFPTADIDHMLEEIEQGYGSSMRP
jgi:rubrerythrin